jgi:hypothetical protein
MIVVLDVVVELPVVVDEGLHSKLVCVTFKGAMALYPFDKTDTPTESALTFSRYSNGTAKP